MGTPSATLPVEQKWVGFVIGPGGESLRRVQEACGVTVQVDQASKDQGYSVLQIFGPKEGADKAAAMVEQKLAEIDPTRHVEGSTEEMRVEQSIVGYLLGKG